MAKQDTRTRKRVSPREAQTRRRNCYFCQEGKTFEEAQGIAQTLEQAEVRFDVKAGPTGSLFGSVTATDIADELWRLRKVRIDRRKVELPEPIKRVGRYSIPIDLFQDVRIEVKTLVVPEGGELPPEEPEVEEAEVEEAEVEEAEAHAGEPPAEAEPPPA